MKTRPQTPDGDELALREQLRVLRLIRSPQSLDRSILAELGRPVTCRSAGRSQQPIVALVCALSLLCVVIGSGARGYLRPREIYASVANSDGEPPLARSRLVRIPQEAAAPRRSLLVATAVPVHGERVRSRPPRHEPGSSALAPREPLAAPALALSARPAWAAAPIVSLPVSMGRPPVRPDLVSLLSPTRDVADDRPVLLAGQHALAAGSAPLYKRPWFWTVIGVAAAGVAAGITAATLSAGRPSFDSSSSHLLTSRFPCCS